MNKLIKTLMIIIVILVAPSCGKQPPKFLTNGPFYLKGLKEVERGDDAKAEASFLKDLTLKKSYAGHLQLMFLYEHQEKYPETIVQCDQYLAVASDNDSNLDLVKEIKKNAMESLHLQLNSQFGTVAAQKNVNKEKVENFFREKWYESRVRERDLQQKLADLESKEKLSQLIDKVAEKPQVPKSTVKKKGKPSQKQVVKTYRVVKGDSLSVISSKVFGSSKRWRDIQSANLPALDNPNKLRVGQIINIPQSKKEKAKQPSKKHTKASIKKDINKSIKNKSKSSTKETEIDKTKNKTTKPSKLAPEPKKILTTKPIGQQFQLIPRGRN